MECLYCGKVFHYEDENAEQYCSKYCSEVAGGVPIVSQNIVKYYNLTILSFHYASTDLQ